VAFDGAIGLVYILGSMQTTRAGFFGLMFGKSAA
jgi:hypothetical protein